MKKKVAAAALAVTGFAIAGCAPSSSDHKSNEPIQVLSFEPVQGKKLSETQKGAFREYVKEMNGTNLDELLFVSSDESESDRKEREQKLATLDSTRARVLSQAKQNCQISQPEKQTAGSLNGPGSTQTETRAGRIDGDRCPITANRVQINKMKLAQINGAAKSIPVTLDMTNTQDYLVRDASLAKDLGAQRTHLALKAGGTMNVTVDDAGNTKTSGTVKGTGEGQFVDGRGIAADMSFELQVYLDEARNFTETVAYVKLTVAGTEYDISMHASGDPKNPGSHRTEYYLNGEKTDGLEFLKFNRP